MYYALTPDTHLPIAAHDAFALRIYRCAGCGHEVMLAQGGVNGGVNGGVKEANFQHVRPYKTCQGDRAWQILRVLADLLKGRALHVAALPLLDAEWAAYCLYRKIALVAPPASVIITDGLVIGHALRVSAGVTLTTDREAAIVAADDVIWLDVMDLPFDADAATICAYASRHAIWQRWKQGEAWRETLLATERIGFLAWQHDRIAAQEPKKPVVRYEKPAEKNIMQQPKENPASSVVRDARRRAAWQDILRREAARRRLTVAAVKETIAERYAIQDVERAETGATYLIEWERLRREAGYEAVDEMGTPFTI